MDWKIIGKITAATPPDRLQQLRELLLNERGLSSSADINAFFDPAAPDLELINQLSDLDKRQLNLAITRIKRAIAEQQPILIYGDYDCDGVCATALLWEQLHALGALVRPFIPKRADHGYGLSVAGLKEALTKFTEPPLIITVDNGISAAAVVKDFPESEFIITDHHQPPPDLPRAVAIVHTRLLCGTGVAWVLASQLSRKPVSAELVALATVCDLLPLVGANRRLLIAGLREMRQTSRPGLQALYVMAGIKDSAGIDTYHLGFLVGPRINAVGRLGHGLDALRLLCTRKPAAAAALAHKLSQVNQDRQLLTEALTHEARGQLEHLSPLPKVLVVASPNFHEGIIGLVASKLVEQHHRPAVAVSLGEIAKGSARSVPGVDITQLLTQAKINGVEMGGHTQAAGFRVPAASWAQFAGNITKLAENIDEALLVQQLALVAALEPKDINFDLWELISQFAPFGFGNPQPMFSSQLKFRQGRQVGIEGKHLQLDLSGSQRQFKAIGFGLGPRLEELKSMPNSIWAYCLDKNTWQGMVSLQLQVKDFKMIQ